MGYFCFFYYCLLWLVYDVREEVLLIVKEKMCYMIIIMREVVLKNKN